jgi:hypothetical protein
MDPSHTPDLSIVSAACTVCDVKTSLSADRAVQQHELRSFFAVHNGHGPMGYRLQISTPRDRETEPVRKTAGARKAGSAPRLSLPSTVSFAYRVGSLAWLGLSARVLRNRDWPFA